jgi:hypothetical protein
VITLVILAVVAVILYLVLARVPASDTTALVLGILSVLTVVMFWLGLPPLFAAAAASVALPAGAPAEGATGRSGS